MELRLDGGIPLIWGVPAKAEPIHHGGHFQWANNLLHDGQLDKCTGMSGCTYCWHRYNTGCLRGGASTNKV